MAQGNLIMNGGFESGTAPWQGTFGYYKNSSNTVDGSAVGVLVDISSSTVGRTLNQTFPTTPGERYEIFFALRLPELFEVVPGIWVPVLGNSRGGSTTIGVQWNGATIGSFPVENRDQWRFYRLKALAKQSSTQLMFFNPSDAAWPFIDAIRVTPIPEPSTLGFLATASAFFAGFRLYRSNMRRRTLRL